MNAPQTFAEPIVVAGQIYIHNDANVPLVVTRADNSYAYYSGYELVATGAPLNERIYYQGRCDFDTLVSRFSVPSEDEIIGLHPRLRALFESLIPEGTPLTQGFIADAEDGWDGGDIVEPEEKEESADDADDEWNF